MSCPACAAHAANPLCGDVRPDCMRCTLRELANGPQFFASMRAGGLTRPYKEALKRIFGGTKDLITAGHAQVLAYREEISNRSDP